MDAEQIGTQININKSAPDPKIVIIPLADNLGIVQKLTKTQETIVDLEHMTFRETLDYAFQQSVNILSQEHMNHAPHILSAARRVSKIFNQEFYQLGSAHLDDILFDLQSYQGVTVDKNEAQFALQQIKKLVTVYYPATYKLQVEQEDFLTQAIENFVYDKWHFSEETSIEEQAKILRSRIAKRIISYSLLKNQKMRKINNFSSEFSDREGESIDNDRIGALADNSGQREIDSVLDRISLTPTANQIFTYCITFELTPQELVKKGLFSQAQIDSAISEFKQVYFEDSHPSKGLRDPSIPAKVEQEEQKQYTKLSEVHRTAEEKFQNLASKTSLKQLFILIEELNYSEKCALLHSFGYFKPEMSFREFVKYMEVGQATYLLDKYRAMIKLDVLTHDPPEEPVTEPKKSIAQTVLDLDSRITLSTDKSRIKLGSVRMQLCELLVKQPELINRLPKTQRQIVQLATLVSDGKLLSLGEIATIGDITYSSVELFLTEALRSINKKDGKFVTSNGLEIKKGSPYEEIITQEVTDEQITSLPQSLQELFFYMRTPQNGVYPSIPDLQRKIGAEHRNIVNSRMAKLLLVLNPENKDILFDTNLSKIKSWSAREKLIRMKIIPEQLARLSEEERQVISVVKTSHDGLYLSPMEVKTKLEALGISQTNIYMAALQEKIVNLLFDTNGKIIKPNTARGKILKMEFNSEQFARLTPREQEVIQFIKYADKGKYPTMSEIQTKVNLKDIQGFLKDIVQVVESRKHRFIDSSGNVIDSDSAYYKILVLLKNNSLGENLSLTDKQHKVIEFIFTQHAKTGKYPSYNDITSQFYVDAGNLLPYTIRGIEQSKQRLLDTNGRVIQYGSSYYRLVHLHPTIEQLQSLTQQQQEAFHFITTARDGRYPSTELIQDQLQIKDVLHALNKLIKDLEGQNLRLFDTNGKLIPAGSSFYRLLQLQPTDVQLQSLTQQQQEAFHFITTARDGRYPSTELIQDQLQIKDVRKLIGKLLSSFEGQNMRLLDTNGRIIRSDSSYYRLLQLQPTDVQLQSLTQQQQEAFHFITTARDGRYPSTELIQDQLQIKGVLNELDKLLKTLEGQNMRLLDTNGRVIRSDSSYYRLLQLQPAPSQLVNLNEKQREVFTFMKQFLLSTSNTQAYSLEDLQTEFGINEMHQYMELLLHELS